MSSADPDLAPFPVRNADAFEDFLKVARPAQVTQTLVPDVAACAPEHELVPPTDILAKPMGGPIAAQAAKPDPLAKKPRKAKQPSANASTKKPKRTSTAKEPSATASAASPGDAQKSSAMEQGDGAGAPGGQMPTSAVSGDSAEPAAMEEDVGAVKPRRSKRTSVRMRDILAQTDNDARDSDFES